MQIPSAQWARLQTFDAVKSLLLASVCLSCLALPSQGKVPSGPWTPSKIPEGWVVHETKNYQIQSQAGMEKAKRLGEHMEVMNRVYRSMFKPDKSGSKLQVIKLLSSRESYLRYGAPPSSAAYYSRTDREMVCYDTGKWSDESRGEGPTTPGAGESKLERRMRRMDEMMTMDILGCAAHEGWHQYFDWLVVSFVILPSWINEGLGDYFYTAAPKEVRGKKIPAELGRLNEGRLLVLKAALRHDRFVPLQQLLSMSKNDFYANASVCYAEGWAFCQFLLHSGNQKYAKIISNFVRLVKDDSKMEAVTERAFKGLDLAVMETEFKQWIEGLKFPGLEEDESEQAPSQPPAGENPTPPGESPPVTDPGSTPPGGTPPAPAGTGGGTPPGGTPPAPAPGTGTGTPPGGTPPAPTPGTGSGTPPGGTPPTPTPTPGGSGTPPGGTPPGGTPPAPTPTPGGGGTPPGGNGG